EPVEEPIFEKALNDVEQTFDDKMDTADETQADVVPKILKKNKLWFNEMVQAEKPPLMFNELMSTPIDFFAFSMNHLKLNKITREVLVGLVFNLLKGVEKDLGYATLREILLRHCSQNVSPEEFIVRTGLRCAGLGVEKIREKILKLQFGLANKDMPLREWTTKDKKRTSIMAKNIDDRLFKRRILRSLEVLGASFTQGMIPSIPIGGSISPEGFLLPILLLVMIIAMVIVTVVVVVAVGWANEFYQNKASSLSVLIANFTLFFSAQLLRENIDSVRLNQRMRPTTPSVPLK
ncbi:hypothetical protein Tco_1084091, partial [Tanacetum coccineum]